MTAIEIINEIRRDILDDPDSGEPENNLWSNTFLLSALNQAEREIARRTLCLTDDTTDDLADFSASPGWTALDSRVLYVDDALVAGDRVTFATEQHLREKHGGTYEDDTGTPAKFLLRGNRIRFYPNLTAAAAVILTVNRLPLAPMSYDSTPEVPTDYVPAMHHYVAYLAFLKNDAKAFNRNTAGEHLGIFTSMVGPGLTLKQLYDRKNRTPQHGYVRDASGDYC